MFGRLNAGKTIKIVSPTTIDFRIIWKQLSAALIKIGLSQIGSPPLCLIFEFDDRDALLSYDKYVRLSERHPVCGFRGLE